MNFRSLATKYGFIGAGVGAGVTATEGDADATLLRADKFIKGLNNFRHPITGQKVAELSDAGQKVIKHGKSGEIMKLGDVLEHPELYKLRPWLPNAQVKWHDKNLAPFYNEKTQIIGLPARGENIHGRNIETLSDITHEGSGHLIAHAEGMPTGSSPTRYPEYNLYEQFKYSSDRAGMIADARLVFDQSKKTRLDKKKLDDAIDAIMEFGISDAEFQTIRNSSEKALRQSSDNSMRKAYDNLYIAKNKYGLSTGELTANEIDSRKFLSQDLLNKEAFLEKRLQRLQDPNNLPSGQPITEYFRQPFDMKKLLPAVGAVGVTALPDTSNAAIQNNYAARPEVAEQAKKEAYWRNLIDQSNKEYALRNPEEEGLGRGFLDPADVIGTLAAPQIGIPAKIAQVAADEGFNFTVDNLPNLLETLQKNKSSGNSQFGVTW